jgi:hypothetical protein
VARLEGVLLSLVALLALTGCAAPDLAGPSAQTTPYVLFAPLQSQVTYLMTLDGQLVHSWRADSNPTLSVYLLPNGVLLRPRSLGQGAFPTGGGNGGRVEELDWDGHVVWAFEYFGIDHQQHHDVRYMPNGHVLMLAWEKRTGAEAVAAGRDPETIPANDEVWVDTIVEVDPLANAIVWTWRAWDHLVPPGASPADRPELIDPNAYAVASSSDWTHANAVDYNQQLDQVMVSVRNHSEIWVIDHSTTTDEAQSHAGGRHGHGGDLIFRWGNPGAYGLPAPAQQQLFGQHNAHWIEAGLPGAGDVLIFDNGDSVLRPYSTAVQIAPTVLGDGSYAYDPQLGFAPASPNWQYVADPPTSFFASYISSAQRLASGDTLLCDGPGGHFVEVTSAGQTVWSYLVTDTNGASPVTVFRATRYEGDYGGLIGRNLTPEGPVRVEIAQ